MKKLQTLLTVAILSWMGASTGTAQAGNYRPTNPGTVTSNPVGQKQIGPVELKATTATATGIKTANWFDGCYTVPVCNGGYCAPVTRCNAPCSPYGTRPYFPATGMGYGNYGGYGGYGYGGYGVGYPNYGGMMGGYGGYSTPIYTAPINQGVGFYGSPMMTSPVVAPTISPVITPTFGSGIVAPVNGVYPSTINGGFTQPAITQPVLTNPAYNSPFYP